MPKERSLNSDNYQWRLSQSAAMNAATKNPMAVHPLGLDAPHSSRKLPVFMEGTLLRLAAWNN
jgi:hypothetical protein